MNLILSIVMCPAGSNMDGQQHKFTEQGGSFGRAPDNTWVLNDPSRYVSSKHAEIKFDGTQFKLFDCSTNGTYLNGSMEPVGMMSQPVLNTGDFLQLGDYRLQVTIQSVVAQAAPEQSVASVSSAPVGGNESLDDLDKWLEPAAPKAQTDTPPVQQPLVSNPAPVSQEGLGIDLGTPQEQKDPLAALGLGEQPQVQSSPSQGGLSDLVQDTPPLDQQMMRVPNVIPDDWDDLLGGEPPASPTHQDPAPEQAAQLNDIDPNATTLLPDQGSSDASGSSHTIVEPLAQAEPLASAEPARPSVPETASVSASEMGLEDLLSAPSESISQNSSPTAHAEMPEVSAASSQNGGVQSQSVSSSAPTGSSAPELAEALGLSLTPEQLQGLNGMIAETVQEMVSGMMRTLRARSEIKSEFRMNMTTIQSAENNPLKFSVTPEDAIENMFAKTGKAYLSPVDSIADGFADIADHQLALFEAMRAAYDNILNQFDADKLENKFESAKGKGLLGGGKGKNWDLYRAQMDEFHQDKEATFKRLFGDVFADAYERRMHSLKMNRKK